MSGHRTFVEPKPRRQNFRSEEKELLVNLIVCNASVIENKETNYQTLQQKTEAWMRLTATFNEQSINKIPRDIKQLQTFWETLKRNAKKYAAEFVKEGYITGGGESLLFDDPLLEKINAVIGKSATGYENKFDSDGLHCPLKKIKTTEDVPVAFIDLLNDDDENISPNKAENCEQVFDYLKKDTSKIPLWNSWSKESATKPLSYPLKMSVKTVSSTQVYPSDDETKDTVCNSNLNWDGDGTDALSEKLKVPIDKRPAVIKKKYPFHEDETRFADLMKSNRFAVGGSLIPLNNTSEKIQDNRVNQPGLNCSESNISVNLYTPMKLSLEVAILQTQLKKEKLKCEILELQKAEIIQNSK